MNPWQLRWDGDGTWDALTHQTFHGSIQTFQKSHKVDKTNIEGIETKVA